MNLKERKELIKEEKGIREVREKTFKKIKFWNIENSKINKPFQILYYQLHVKRIA